ncbi:MAG: PP2C family protein-serine/threonine phosphatase [Paracoccaceae bacterium]
MNTSLFPQPTDALSADEPRRRVLIVDDSRMQRRILSASLQPTGYEVVEASSGPEALSLLAEADFDVVISDWMMPGMSGLELCRAFRALPRNYAYFILLTSKSEKNEIAQGLDGGADDFLTKPVSAGELRARIAAGERILSMQRQLREKNRLVTSTLEKIRGMYDSLNRDLKEARKLQQSLMPERSRDFVGATVTLDIQSSGHVGGDLAGFFPIGKQQLGLFSIDVSGHGVASALMTARLAGFFSGTMPERNIALIAAEDGSYRSRDPAEVAHLLNRMICEETESDRYLTLFYGVIDLVDGSLCFVQAGHPHPAVLRASGGIERLGGGGLPVGLLAEADYETTYARLYPGDRLAIVSDGVTECEDMQGVQFDEGGFEHFLHTTSHRPPTASLQLLMQTLSFHREGQPMADDISALLVDYAGITIPAKNASPALPRQRNASATGIHSAT